MTLKTIPWSIQDSIKTPEDQASYIEAALELAVAENDPGFFAAALGDVAKARGIAEVADETGLTRAGLYKALSADGDPRLSSLLGVIKALDLQLSVSPRQKQPPKSTPAGAPAPSALRKPRKKAAA